MEKSNKAYFKCTILLAAEAMQGDVHYMFYVGLWFKVSSIEEILSL